MTGHTIWPVGDSSRADETTSKVSAESSKGAREGEEQARTAREEDNGGYQEECQGWEYGESGWKVWKLGRGFQMLVGFELVLIGRAGVGYRYIRNFRTGRYYGLSRIHADLSIERL